MRQCVISISDIKYFLIFGEDGDAVGSEKVQCADACPLFLSPSERFDFKVRCTSPFCNLSTEPFFICAALSFFFHTVRGLPTGSVDVELDGLGGVKKLSLFDTSDDKIGISLPKCKEIFAYNYTGSDGVPLGIFDISLPEKYRGLLCERPEQFDKIGMSRLRISEGLSYARRVFVLGSPLPHELIIPLGTLDIFTLAAAVNMLEYSGKIGDDGTCSVSYRGREIRFCKSEHGFLLPVSFNFLC